jgi:alcohol dehydrogenase
MSDIILSYPGRILYGPDTINRIGQVAARYGSRALVVTESVFVNGDYLDRIQQALSRRSISAIVYNEVKPDQSTAGIDDVVGLARASRAQVVIGLGGMRVLAVARIVAAAAQRGVELIDLFDGDIPDRSEVCYLELPTSFRDHFMFRESCVITDGGTRNPRMVTTPLGATRAVVLDPNLSFSLTAKYAAAAMLDLMLAAVEGYISVRASFLSDTLLLRAIQLLGEALQGMQETPEELKHRVRATEAGLLTAMGLSTSSQAAGGALSYTINSRYSVPKSFISSILLPHVLDTSVHARPEKLRRITHALGEEVRDLTAADAAYRGSAAVRRIIGQMELPARLRELDLNIDELVDVADIASTLDMTASAPTPHGASDLYDLIKLAF